MVESTVKSSAAWLCVGEFRLIGILKVLISWNRESLTPAELPANLSWPGTSRSPPLPDDMLVYRDQIQRLAGGEANGISIAVFTSGNSIGLGATICNLVCRGLEFLERGR